MIRIENLYYLLCYAWEILPERSVIHADAEKSPSVLALLATVFLNQLSRQMKTGLPHRYVPVEEEYQGIRGRILFSETLRKHSFQTGKTVCHFDEFSVNHELNRILKSTLHRLHFADELPRALRQRAIRFLRSLTNVETTLLSSSLIQQQLHYTRVPAERLLLHISQLLHEELLVNEQTGTFTFREFWRDEKRMNLVFETFVRNFYRLEQRRFMVWREQITWQLEASEADRSFLPRMVTDISLESQERKIIIDTKYYAETLQRYFDAQKVHSTHLYQLFAYVKNQRQVAKQCEGILLYPVVSRSLSLKYSQGPQQIRVETIDLSQPWQRIHERLLELIQ